MTDKLPNTPLDGGEDSASTLVATAVVTGIFKLAFPSAATRFLIAGRTEEAEPPGMTSLPAVMYRKLTELAKGTTLVLTHSAAKEGLVASF
ncbi:putative glucan endo-1,3-beta-glucosidase GVI [Iris pallida]|uniref:Glucan endo-1,3-beta-glucosidase GVI n=1 Tax=Iris pallida TaxID=29817 RepID=A0AAX6G5V1_IRIPA|nr:putative glucan endo-1,3-beta-glucosidase GVI [Iris pallida]KAJ6823823.1 putative glucan endo-1,3-beta-glucosidase GVI [Iris pallida]